MASKLKTTATLGWAKSTPGTHQYLEEGDKAEHRIGSLYLKKSVVGEGDPPQRIRVTVREIDDE